MTDEYKARSKLIQTLKGFLEACSNYQNLPIEGKPSYIDSLLTDMQFHANRVLQLGQLSEETSATTLDKLPLTEGMHRELKKAGYNTLGDLIIAGREKAKRVKNVGDKKLDKLNRELLRTYQVEIL